MKSSLFLVAHLLPSSVSTSGCSGRISSRPCHGLLDRHWQFCDAYVSRHPSPSTQQHCSASVRQHDHCCHDHAGQRHHCQANKVTSKCQELHIGTRVGSVFDLENEAFPFFKMLSVGVVPSGRPVWRHFILCPTCGTVLTTPPQWWWWDS